MADNKNSIKCQPQDIADRLTNLGIRPTAVRLLVYRYLESVDSPVSNLDIEIALETVDKSTIFRTISIFIEQNVVHTVDDGSGLLKYEICRASHEHSIHDMHVHFRCTHCNRTVCLPSTAIPIVNLPDGFIANNANYVISGICDKCSQIISG